MATYFIVGATRGIGLALVRETLEVNTQNKVIAGARKPTDELLALQKSNPKFAIVQIDITSDKSVKDAANETAKIYPQGIDYLIVNAAVMGKSSLDAAELLAVMDVNVAGPLRVVNEFYPQVKKSNRKVIAIVSSISGAHASQDMLNGFYNVLNVPSPAFYPYRVSKAALNLLAVLFAKDHAKDGVIIVPVHPGGVDTAMFYESGGTKEFAGKLAITPEESAKKQLALYLRLTIEDTGKFFSYTGEVLPW